MNFRVLNSLLFLSFLLGAHLSAQVDPRLQESKTDVLDVYFGSTTLTPKPEVITLIDNSASMGALYWSNKYYADSDTTSVVSATGQSWHKTGYAGAEKGDFSNRSTPVVYLTGAVGSVRVWVNLHTTNAGSTTTPTSTTPYDLARNALLIKPNGDPVSEADFTTDADKLNAKKWVMRASHIRLSYTSNNVATTYDYKLTNGTTVTYTVGNLDVHPQPYSTGAYAAYSATSGTEVKGTGKIRVVDIPLPWATFDRVPYYEGENRTLSPAPSYPSSGNGGYANAVADKHPQHTYIWDPVPSVPAKAQYYEVDTIWSQGYGGVDGIMNPWTSSTVTGSKGKIGAFHYSADYLWWCFFGQDEKIQGALPGAAQHKAYSGSNVGSYTVPDVREGGVAWRNDLPGITRMAAIKKALVATWIDNQDLVQWQIRFFYGNPGPPTAYDSRNSAGTPSTRDLLVLDKPDSANLPGPNFRRILGLIPAGRTPLTTDTMDTLGQFSTTNTGDSKFNKDTASCTKSFLIILSDGAPTDKGGSADPYATGVSAGNKIIRANPSYLKGTTGGAANFNNFPTIVGIAAHYFDSELTTDTDPDTVPAAITGMPTDSNASVKKKVPWIITTRPTGTRRRINTMTIGVSLEGTLNDVYGSKKGMYTAALYGWETRLGPWNLANPPLPYDQDNPLANSKDNNPFYFDASDPDELTEALTTAISLAKSATNTLGAPVAPLVGLSVGNQTYIGTFATSNTGIWKGDLLMAGLRVNGRAIEVIDAEGNTLDNSGGLDAGNANWSTSDSLAARGWKYRNIYTLKPSGAVFSKTLLKWDESTSTTDLPDTSLNVTSKAERLNLIRFMMGASPDAQIAEEDVTEIEESRVDIMGDIVNSTPLIVSFPLSALPSSGILADFKAAHPTYVDYKFRLIIAGTNQGVLHGFGEISATDNSDPTKPVPRGAVDELWAFIPPDLLSGLKAWRDSAKHRYLVDGSPVLYLNERGIPNGVVDNQSTTADFARVIFGLRKGGRSYYCMKFDSNDPTKPLIEWMIRPDDIAPTDVSSPNNTIKRMGFSTSTPTIARIKDGTVTKDVFLIAGGDTTSDVDTKFSALTSAVPPGYGAGTKLGRFILALNVVDGSVVKSWDFINDASLNTDFPNIGAIPAAVTPVEVIPGSFSTQRVYFSDKSGGVYAVGAMPGGGLRSETNQISTWKVRRIYTPNYSGTPVSTSPVAFTLPNGYPVARTSDPKPVVAAIGVIVGTGDRNDPMDLDTVNPSTGGATFRNRLLMILDRQDSADITGSLGKVDKFGYTDGDLTDLTTVASDTDEKITPSHLNYYLKTTSGYYLNYTVGAAKSPAPTDVWQRYAYQKSVTSPAILNQVLFFTNFAPAVSSGLCAGSGTSITYRMCNVLHPVYASGGTTAAASTTSCTSGATVFFNDIPSELATVGLSGVLQAGETQNLGTGTGKTALPPIPGAPPAQAPRPRAWRIIR